MCKSMSFNSITTQPRKNRQLLFEFLVLIGLQNGQLFKEKMPVPVWNNSLQIIGQGDFHTLLKNTGFCHSHYLPIRT